MNLFSSVTPRLALLVLPILVLFLLAFQTKDDGTPREGEPSLSQLARDTVHAGELMEMAKVFVDSAKYDSALVYYQKAAQLYSPYLEEIVDTSLWKGLLKCNNDIGYCYRRLAKYEKSLEVLTSTLEQAKKYLGETHSEVATSYSRMGNVYRDQRDFKAALENHQKALNIRKAYFGEIHPEVAKSYRDIGIVNYHQKSYETALKNHQNALNIQLAYFGKTHPEVAKSYNNIGTVYWRKGAYNEALENYEKALNINIATYGETHIQVAVSYSSMGNIYWRKGAYNEALENYEKALNINIATYGETHPRIASNYFNFGVFYWSQGDFEASLEYYQKALNIQRTQLGESDPEVAKSYMNIGMVYDILGFYKEALEHYQKSLAIRSSVFGGNSPEVATVYYYIAISYWHQGAYDLALEYNQKALKIRSAVYGEKHYTLGLSYSNIGNVYNAKGNYETALENYQKALEIELATYGETHSKIADGYSRIGSVFASQRAYELALENYQKALGIQLAFYGEKHYDLANSYSGIGLVYRYQENNKAALENYQEALAIRLATFGEKHPLVAYSYQTIGSSYIEQGAYQEALKYFQRALQANANHFEEKDLSQNPTFTDEVLSEIRLLEILQQKGWTLFKRYSNQSDQIQNLHLAHQTYQFATAWIDHMRQGFKRETDKEALLKKVFDVYEGAIETSLSLYHRTKQDSFLQQVFTVFEKSRSILLLENLQATKAKAFADLPEELLEQEYDISNRLASHEKFLFEEQLKKENADTAKIALWQDRVFSLRQTKDSIIAVFESRHPAYYHLKYAPNVASIQDAQTHLPDEQTALLEYFTGDSSIYVFLIGKQDYQCIEIKKDFPLEEWVRQFQRSAYTYHLSPESTENLYKNYADTLVTASRQLYEKIFAPIAAQYDLPKKLIISPDGILGYLPFEVLLQETPEDNYDFSGHAYLLKDHQIGYAYSATLLQEMKEKQFGKASGTFIAFAPAFESQPAPARTLMEVRAGLGQLKYNIPEAEALQVLLGGQIYTGPTATEEKFIREAPNYKIIHLATHGKANDQIGEYAYLAFAEVPDSIENERLYNRDLYNLRLKADMVVLSACETGIGELQRGEGIISLARGFSYAGAKSIITTLWSVDDIKSKELMEGFYGYIKAGKTKDEALRLAKLDYLANHSDRNVHPFFWAGFIAIGDMAPVVLSSGWTWWGWGLAVGLLTIVSIYYFRRKNNLLKTTD